QRDDLHEALRTKLTSDRPKDTGTDRLVLLVDQDGRVAVESNRAAVGTSELFLGADDDRARDLALLDLRAGDRFADRHDDDIADSRVTTTRTAEHLDAEHFLRAAVVRDVEDAGHLDHDYFSRPCSSVVVPLSTGSSALWLIVRRMRQRLVRD